LRFLPNAQLPVSLRLHGREGRREERRGEERRGEERRGEERRGEERRVFPCISIEFISLSSFSCPSKKDYMA